MEKKFVYSSFIVSPKETTLLEVVEDKLEHVFEDESGVIESLETKLSKTIRAFGRMIENLEEKGILNLSDIKKILDFYTAKSDEDLYRKK